MSHLDEKQVDILLNEYNLANGIINGFLSRQDTIVNICLAMIGGSIGFASINDVSDAFYIFIPFIPLMLFSHIAYHYTRIILVQGYRKYLEDQLNAYREINKLKYSHLVKELLLYRTNFFSKSNTWLYIIAMAMSIIYCADSCDSERIKWGIAIVYSTASAVLIYKMMEFRKDLDVRIHQYCTGQIDNVRSKHI